jgi:hypothetical protein
MWSEVRSRSVVREMRVPARGRTAWRTSSEKELRHGLPAHIESNREGYQFLLDRYSYNTRSIADFLCSNNHPFVLKRVLEVMSGRREIALELDSDKPQEGRATTEWYTLGAMEPVAI